MRRALWRHYTKLFRTGDRVLDVCCGTGLDSLFLAGRKIRVTAIDASAGMITVLRRNAAVRGTPVDAHHAPASELHRWPDQTFHGIISGFAGLNAVPNLKEFAVEANRLLRPGGRMVAHMLAPPGICEWLPAILQWRWREAQVMWTRRGETIDVCGQPLDHILLRARDTYRAFFEDRFALRGCYGLGFLPNAAAPVAGIIEPLLGSVPPFLNWARFFVLDLGKR
jgi:SAM-dependent methyltransferase